MVLRSGTRLSRPITPPTCSHCGVQGHISTVCPRSTYSPDIPALACNHCIRTVRSGHRSEPDGTQIVVTIDPCTSHSSPVIRPNPPHTPASALASATTPLVRPTPPPRPVVPTAHTSTSTPAPPAPGTPPPPYTPPVAPTTTPVVPPPPGLAPPYTPAATPGIPARTPPPAAPSSGS